MGSEYKWFENPLRDFLFQLILMDNDIASNKISSNIEENIYYILSGVGIDEDYLKYLDYSIDNTDNYFKVIPNNILSAMWFCGFFPSDCDLIFDKKSIIFDNINFKFNTKTKKLTWAVKK